MTTADRLSKSAFKLTVVTATAAEVSAWSKVLSLAVVTMVMYTCRLVAGRGD